jgi:hypothetical protein
MVHEADWNLESFYYETGILPSSRPFSKKNKALNHLKIAIMPPYLKS